MMQLRWTLMLSALLIFVLAGVTPADEKEEAKLTAEEQKREDLARKELLAMDLARYGKENKSAEALVTAAGILIKLAHQTPEKAGQGIALAEVDEKGNPVKEVQEEKSFKQRVNALFADALEVGDAKTIQTLINQVKDREDYKGMRPIGGPKRISRTVDAGKVQSFEVKYKKGERAMITMQSNHAVRFVIKDGASRVSSTVAASYFYHFNPKHTVRIEVHGMGRVAKYTVVAN